jgi:hypothetical protein
VCPEGPQAAKFEHSDENKLNLLQYTPMKISIPHLKKLLAALTVFALVSFSAASASPSDQDKQFLAGYEKVRSALVVDDLAAAKAAAKDLGEQDEGITKTSSLKDARLGFEKLSVRAKTLVEGEAGYHVFHCPMLQKDWVQISTTAGNPYAGKAMPTCGEIRK